MTASAGSAGGESPFCTRISLPMIATRSVKVPPVSIPTIIAPRLRCFTVSRRSQQYFEIGRILRRFEGGDALVERKTAVDQRARIDFTCRECVERGLKTAASRSDHGDFVDDDRRQIDFSRGRRGALQNDLSARAD